MRGIAIGTILALIVWSLIAWCLVGACNWLGLAKAPASMMALAASLACIVSAVAVATIWLPTFYRDDTPAEDLVLDVAMRD